MFHWYEKKQGSEFDNKWHCHSPRVRDAGSDGLGVLQSLGFIGEGTPPLYLSTHRCCRVEVNQCCQIVRFFRKC